jgi:hypothetical protein
MNEMGGNEMTAKHTDPKTGVVIDDMAVDLIAALKNARDQGQPFLMPWRQPDSQHWKCESDAGCGCGGGSFV